MIKFILSFVLLAALALAPSLSFAQTITLPTEMPLNDKQIKRLKNGKPVVSVKKHYTQNGKTAKVFSMIIIDAHPEQIWSVLTDCQRAPEYVPGLKSCEILERSVDGNWEIRRHINNSKLLPKMVSEFRNDFAYPHSISFVRTGGDLSINQGEWRLSPIEGTTKTLVTYNCTLAAKTVIPDSMIRKSIRKKIPKVMLALEEEVMTDINTARLTNVSTP